MGDGPVGRRDGMTPDTRQHMTAGVRLRFVLRLLGIFGVLLAAAGLIYLSSLLTESSLGAIFGAVQGEQGAAGTIAALVFWLGIVLAVVAVVFEFVQALSSESSERGAAEAN